MAADARSPHPVIEGARIVLRPTTDADLDLLVGWFSRPDVVKYWGGERLAVSVVAAKYVGRRRPAVECFLVLADDEPVGLIQYHGDAAQSGGIDMFLLEEHRGVGIGRAAVNAIVEYLADQLGWSSITVDPDEWNHDGQAFWAAVGFAPVQEVRDEEGREPYLLMRCSTR